MTKISSLFKAFFVTTMMASGVAANATGPLDADPLRAVLLESKEKNRGVNIHASGNNIGMIVTAVDDHYVIGRSQTTSRIVIRLDRIDGVSAQF